MIAFYPYLLMIRFAIVWVRLCLAPALTPSSQDFGQLNSLVGAWGVRRKALVTLVASRPTPHALARLSGWLKLVLRAQPFEERHD